jgi:Domain of unknown function (DUF2760)
MLGFWERVAFAFRCFFSILIHAEIPKDVQQTLLKSASETPPAQVVETPTPASRLKEVERPPRDPIDRAVQMLALLQRDGRLIDFLAENIAPYPDTQLGAAARTIHESCRQVLERYVKLESILDSQEDQPVTVQAGFDPAAIKLVGAVKGVPPIRGRLLHKGWRVKDMNLPSLPEGAARMVIAPAEVEVP